VTIVRLYSESGSLGTVFARCPAWWAPIAKAKGIAGIVFGLRSAYSLELVHGRLTASNTLFDSDKRIQISDFHSIGLPEYDKTSVSGGFCDHD
jgi:hypothetical protein